MKKMKKGKKEDGPAKKKANLNKTIKSNLNLKNIKT